MQHSIVKYKTVKESSDFRIDAEFFKPEFLLLETKLIEGSTCSDILEYLTDGTHQTPKYTTQGIVFLSSGNIEPNYIHFKNTKYISEEEHAKLQHCQPEAYDVLVSKSGRIGHAAVVSSRYKKGDFNIYEGIALLRLQNFNSFAFSVIFNSVVIQNQIKRLQKGVAQPHLHLEDIRNIKVPKFGDGFLNVLKSLSMEVHKRREYSESLYFETEQLLLSELGLLDWKPIHELSFVKNFSETQEAKRFDAEYFQPRYEEMVEVVKKYKGGFDELGNLVEIKDKNFTPKDDEQYKYIELANISSNGEINGYTESYGNELPSRARRKVQKNDLIVSSIEGSLTSIALITEDWKNALCSTGFFIVSSENLNPETLLILFKTKVGQLQLKKGCKGTILTAISKGELEKIVLPKIDPAVQNQIKEKIIEMYETKNLSKSLLEIAKQGVEMAIEKNEKEAEKWINSEIEKLGVKID